MVGADPGDCIKKGSGYLKTSLDTMAAHYLLALVRRCFGSICCKLAALPLSLNASLPAPQERAPQMLRTRTGNIGLQWILTVAQARHRSRLGITTGELHAFVRDWPRSEEGRRLLEGLRCGLG